MSDERAARRRELEARLDAGEWLRSGEVAELLGVGKNTVVRMLTGLPARKRRPAIPPSIRYQLRPGSGHYRECNPDDVRAQLELRRGTWRGRHRDPS